MFLGNFSYKRGNITVNFFGPWFIGWKEGRKEGRGNKRSLQCLPLYVNPMDDNK
jgi:hypothetical protein